MLAEERMEEIVRLVQEYGSMTVQKLMEYTGASESTLRRDLNALDKRGMLTKVHGCLLYTSIPYAFPIRSVSYSFPPELRYASQSIVA